MAEIPQDKLRIAIEGCGHGTLHAIYASIDEACRVKGWDGIDVLIIGGDFQAVRNQYDLNVTSMPQKYRRMADFHEYYSGSRVAPYLTIFIGGNHEASNHLFELYYGGWVAPNIYYLGAANVLRIGPLRIAGMSGIWKGYDYRKPHFERLPYNREEMSSIYHVRELDARKILSIRSQVDIGLSHDWPQGIEWHGDHQWLFRTKRDFEEEALNGRLGDIAARQCLDRLRPKYWFSAHHHTKYAAIMEHPETNAANQTKRNNGNDVEVNHDSSQSTLFNNGQMSSANVDNEDVAAWRNFHLQAEKIDLKERADTLQALQDTSNDQSSNIPNSGPQYVETFRKVVTDNGLGRYIDTSIDNGPNIDNVDGCGFSRPSKRRREPSEPEVQEQLLQPIVDTTQRKDQPSADNKQPETTSLINPDAIDIEMSDDDLDASDSMPPARISHASENIPLLPRENGDSGGDQVKDQNPNVSNDMSNVGNDQSVAEPQTRSDSHLQDSAEPEVSAEMRAQLAALSNKFQKPQPIEVSPPLPFPDEISNKTTHFLALGKCDAYQEFLQLLEIGSLNNSNEVFQRPLKLSYDPEWLAILRVFAPELVLGTQPTNTVPQHRGETYYREQIEEQLKWVDEHIVQPGKLSIPGNFTVTAPVYDPNLQIGPDEMPREVSNPQTTAFCELIGIENKFDISEDERNLLMSQGPKAVSEGFANHHNRFHGRRGGFSNRGSGGRGGHRGRGRGRGRGRY